MSWGWNSRMEEPKQMGWGMDEQTWKSNMQQPDMSNGWGMEEKNDDWGWNNESDDDWSW